ncbi:YihY/virulence factor BrkB family protein [Labrys monachus]|uniref:Membrane protein n=1 Tax=Labrys monachus TaxID=217067 RepID=A0ABU0FNC7_9HYPH|nr:YihY/virulence factor BrkB family protein [Labrys monachus]MDQ0396118.1 membrane protein [Labrys monachus]
MSRPMGLINFLWRVIQRYVAHDGYAMASHMALSTLTALFPFLIFVTALAGLVGTAGLQEEIVRLLFDSWPHSVASPIAEEVVNVLGSSHPGLVTLSAIIAVVLATNGIEAIRIGANRAYGLVETRSFWRCRLQSLVFVLVAALALITLALFVVLWPVMWRNALAYLPFLAAFAFVIELARYGITVVVLGGAIILIHLFLVASRPRFWTIWPGSLVTLGLWLAGGELFSLYITNFNTYSKLYAGLGGVFAALFFLWLVAVAFLLGAEINALLAEGRAERRARRRP